MNVDPVDELGNTQIINLILDNEIDNAIKINKIKILLEKGSDPDIKNENNETALMIASKLNNHEIVELLLINGADPNIGGLKTSTTLSIDKMRILRYLNEINELYPEKMGESLKYFENLKKNVSNIIETPTKIKEIIKSINDNTNYKEMHDEVAKLKQKFHSDFELMKTTYKDEMEKTDKIYANINESINSLESLIEKELKTTDGRSRHRRGSKSRRRVQRKRSSKKRSKKIKNNKK